MVLPVVKMDCPPVLRLQAQQLHHYQISFLAQGPSLQVAPVLVGMRATATVSATWDHQAMVGWSDPFPFQALVRWAEGV